MKIAKEKEYVLLDDRSSNFLAAIVICLLGALIGGTALLIMDILLNLNG